ncbi:MAG: NAD-dependent epimerase/dehydratase family protein [Actinomycetota bacterium]
MRMLVTGAAGFIGSHLCERLVCDGHEVVGLDRFSPFYDRATKFANLSGLHGAPGFELRQADLIEADPHELLDGIDGVFHLAGQPGVRPSWGQDFEDYLHDNVLASQRLLEALRVRSLPAVLASSSSVYGNAAHLPVGEGEALQPLSPYGVTKQAMEQLAAAYCSQYGLRVVILRYFTVFGPRQRPDMAFHRFIRAALNGEQVQVLGSGRQSRDFTYVADAVDATVKALGAPGGSCYNIGGGHPTSLNEVLATIRELTGTALEVDRGAVAIGDVAHTWADTSAAQRELGWKPSVDLRAGLQAQLAWHQAAQPACRR